MAGTGARMVETRARMVELAPAPKRDLSRLPQIAFFQRMWIGLRP
jgi:hypothetical protein